MKLSLNEIVLTYPRQPLLAELDILHLSDFHLSTRDYAIDELFRNHLSQRVFDLVFLTGDLVDRDEGTTCLIENLSLLKSKYGIFAVWGNHDLFNLSLHHMFTFCHKTKPSNLAPRDLDTFKERLASVNVKVLCDELVSINVNGDCTVTILGLDDWFGVDRLQNWGKYAERIARLKELLGKSPKENMTILLTHIPDLIEKLDDFKIDLTLSGHTHGGQIRLPFYGPLYMWSNFQRKYNKGLYRYNGGYIHVSPGLSASYPIRVFCPPEATLIKVRVPDSL